MSDVKFISTIATQGDRLIITIPKEYHDMVAPMKGKHVFVAVSEAVPK